jgi:outer membrane protein assembly factor BamD (BamD/ComL family)
VRAPHRLATGGLALLLLGGCVYYNGMYNTKRLAGSARSAERDGRTFEATNYWGQVVNRADTLVTRHPDSKYVDEALMLKGTALARLGQCSNAMAPLSRVTEVRGSNDAVEDAYLALARCQLDLGNPTAAEIAVARPLQSKQKYRRQQARLVHARALRLTGRAAEAVVMLDSLPGDRVADERLLALAAAGRRDDAMRVADSLLAQPDSGRFWDSLVVVVGRTDPLTASHIVDRLIERPGTPPINQTRWLLDDAARLEQADTARATARLVQAVKVGGVSPAAASARLQLARKDLQGARTVDDLAGPIQVLDSLAGGAGDGGAAVNETIGGVGEASELRATLVRIREASDSSAARAATADLRLFLAAELARDTLAAPALSTSLFRRVVDDWPDSPYAPKALLAVVMLDPAWADSARDLLATRYAASPYVAYVQGNPLPEYQALEDSLKAFDVATQAVRRRPPTRPGQPTPPVRPGVRRQPTEPDAPGAARRPRLEP